MLSDIPVIANLKNKLQWHQVRQGVLAENVANADTPDFKARDVRAPAYGSRFKAAQLGVAQTEAAHLPAVASSGRGFAIERRVGAWEVTPEGNGVVLEEQMMKVAENQMDYQMATSIYSRAMSLMRIAATGQR